MTNLQVIDCCVPVGTPSLADEEAEATARVFKALGDPAKYVDASYRDKALAR